MREKNEMQYGHTIERRALNVSELFAWGGGEGSFFKSFARALLQLTNEGLFPMMRPHDVLPYCPVAGMYRSTLLSCKIKLK